MKSILSLLVVFLCGYWSALGEVLIVADEFPAMQVLASHLKAKENIDSKIIKQTEMPADLVPFTAVIVYIHGKLAEPAEKAFIDYANQGGKLVVLHHSISSGKRDNKYWFKFLGVELPKGELGQGGYQWTEGVTLTIVNLAPQHYITSHQVKYPSQIPYVSSDRGGEEKQSPGVALPESEVYLNHVLTSPRTILMGLKYQDAKSGKVFMQDRAGWCKQAEKGWIIYLMPGHSVAEFEHPVYAQIVVNAVTFKP